MSKNPDKKIAVTLTHSHRSWVSIRIKREVKLTSETCQYPRIIETFCATGRTILAAIEAGKEVT
jgi:hypothetical protein